MRLRITISPEGSVQDITRFLADQGYVVTGNRILRSEEDKDWILETDVYSVRETKPMELRCMLVALDKVVDAEYIESESQG